MRVIYAAITGMITGFIAAFLMAPRSGRETRNEVNGTLRKQWKDLRMTYNEAAHKIGLISARKKADLNRKAVNAYNAKRKKAGAGPAAGRSNESLKKVHEKAGATKAVDSPTAKSGLRKVPVKG